MIVITVNFYAEEPILTTSFQGDPNSDVSYPYLPGSAIRGALIGRYLSLHPPANDDIVDDNPVIRQLFFEDSTRFLNAYPYIEDIESSRSLPTPASWRQRKDQADCVIDLSSSEVASDEESLERVRKFCCVLDQTVYLHQEQRRINIHNQRDRSKGRATKETGQIYRYESLEKGQTFQSFILCNHEEDGHTLKQLLDNSSTLRIGGSQTAGYGKVRVSSEIEEVAGWNEINISSEKRNHSEVCRITLLSDAIIRNSDGQYTVEPPTEAIADLLGIPEDIAPPSLSYINTTHVGGFNRKWGLPLPQVCAIAAGSVFVFDNLSLTPEQIQQLEWLGIGERRNEGFGRVAVNWLPDIRELFIHQSKKHIPDVTPLTGLPAQLAQDMAKRLLRQQLEQKLEEEVNKWNLNGRVSNSQLSRLVLVANQALQESNKKLVEDFLKNLRSTAKTQFESARVNNQSLKQKCLDWLQDSQWIGTPSPAVDIAGQVAQLDDSLRQEYTLRLIRALAKKFAKANQVQSEELSA